MSNRQEKVSRLLQKDISAILQQETGFLYHGVMVTVTKVRVTVDLKIARVYISIFPGDKANDTLEIIRNNTPRIKNKLGKAVRNQLRVVPELTFFIDDSLDYIEKIDNLLKE